ncbi:MAG: SMI1/KNR4 family protein [Kiloniellales bacterium]|nr:SMI1/KNR4 family protein [Kiloniellales bacterium]
MSLKERLAAIDRAEAAPAFRAPATEAEIRALGEAVSEAVGLDLPEDLATLYRWHDGQAPDQRLVEGETFRLLPIAEALREWRLFLDPESDYLEPYRPTWFPLCLNGNSDYLAYDLEEGSLIAYWHDDPDRDVEHPSLEDWADSLVEELAATAPRQAPAGLIGSEPVESLTLTLRPGKNEKRADVIRSLTQLTGLSLGEVAKAFADGHEGIAIALRESVNSLERAKQIRGARKALELLEAEGFAPSLEVGAGGGETEAAAGEALKQLENRCLTGG